MKRPRAAAPIHKSIRERLGYAEDQTDADVLKDWKERTTRICKPCWELKYCPYGPLVEQAPLLPPERAGMEEQQAYFRKCLEDNVIGSANPLDDERRADIEEWLGDEEVLLSQAVFRFGQQRELEAASALPTTEEQVDAFVGGGPLPPIHEYRVPFEPSYKSPTKDQVSAEEWAELQRLVEVIREEHQRALDTGIDDNRAPLDPVRRAWFRQRVDEYDASEYPDSIPQTFSDAECNIFGHICPVFFAAESMTETEEERRIGRGRMPFGMMMRIVRRDDYRCQHCKKQLRDDEVEFDHNIPVAKGGSSEEHNIRLTCFDCNRDKSDDYVP